MTAIKHFTKRNKKRVGFFSTIIIIACVLFCSTMFTAFAPAKISKNSVTQNYTYYTNQAKTASIPLEGDIEENDNFVVLKKVANDKYALVSCNKIGVEDKVASFSVEANWGTNSGDNCYWAGITKLSLENINDISYETTSRDGVNSILFSNTSPTQPETESEPKDICIVYDNTSPVIQTTPTVSLDSENDRINISFIVTEKNKIDDSKIEVKFGTLLPISSSEPIVINDQTTKYTKSFRISTLVEKLKNGEMYTQALTIDVADMAGNNSIQYIDTAFVKALLGECLKIQDLSINSSNQNNKLAKNGDVITVNFKSTLPLSAGNLTAIVPAASYVIAPVVDKNGKEWTLTYTIDTSYDTSGLDTTLKDNLPVEFILKANINGVEESKTQANIPIIKDENEVEVPTQVILYKDITMNGALIFEARDKDGKIKTKDNNYAVNQDVLKVFFNTTHKVNISGANIIALSGPNLEYKKSVPFVCSSTDQKGMEWTGTYTVDPKTFEPDSVLSFQFILDDDAGNESLSIPQENVIYNTIIYKAPIVLTDVNITSNNAASTSVATNGNQVTISFSAPADIYKPIGKIAGKEVEFKNTVAEPKKWTKVLTLDNSEITDNSKLEFYFTAIPKSIIHGGPATITQDDIATSITYYKPLNVIANTYYIKSNYLPNTSVAKDNDTIKVELKTYKSVTVSDLKIAGVDIAQSYVESGHYRVWTGTYKVESGKTVDQATIAVSFALTSGCGTKVVTQEDALTNVIYYAPIEIPDTKLSFVSNNAKPETVKDKDTITLSFTTQHEVDVDSLKIRGESMESNVAKTSEVDKTGKTWWTYKRDYYINKDNFNKMEDIGYFFSVSDKAGNQATRSSNDSNAITYYPPISINSVSVSSDNAINTMAKNGDSITILLQTQHPVENLTANIKEKEFDLTNPNLDGVTWIGTCVVDKDAGLVDNQDLPISLHISDKSGNNLKLVTETLPKVRYYAPIAKGLTDLTFVSNNEKTTAYAKNGNVVTVSFKTTHPVTASAATIAGKSILLNSKNNDGMNWSGSYTIQKDVVLDNTDISFYYTLNDIVGNAALSKSQEDATKVRYQAPIDAGFSGLAITTNNAKGSSVYTKSGDVVTLKFNTTHPVSLKNTKMAGKDIVLSSEENKGMSWTGTYKVEKGDTVDNNEILFGFTMNDTAGNEAVSKSQANTAKIKYMAPITIQNLSMVSNNVKAGTATAKNGNVITTTFTTTHPVMLSTKKVAGKYVRFSSAENDGMTWTASYTVADGDTKDNEYVTLEFITNDVAGNDAVTSTEQALTTEKVKYYAPMKISNVVITSNNENDTAKYAKDGDTITVKFTTNHDVDVSSSSIAGGDTSVSSAGNEKDDLAKDWTLKKTLQNKEVVDLEKVDFVYSIDDVAGNDQKTMRHTNTEVTNSIQYFAPIEAKTSIVSTGKNSSFAKNNDTIKVNATTNHNTTVVSSSVGTRAASSVGANSMEHTISYTIPTGEVSLKEGALSFAYKITDLAGNLLEVKEVNEGTIKEITYDRSNPSVVASTDFSGFTKEDMKCTFSFEDLHLEANGVSVTINGEEQITNAERATINGTTFSKTVTLDLDDAYEIIGTVTDIAGNKSNPDVVSKVTVDKTNPEITSTKIDFAVPKAYRTGFVISEFFNIKDENVKEIICTVTDGKSVVDWDIETPITSDGKKTIYLMVTDMAGNNSNAVTYDLYIDGTKPKSIIVDQHSGKELVSGVNEEPFISEMALEIKLDALQMGDEKPDHFTALKLVDEEGNLVIDILDTVTPLSDGSYVVEPEAFGTYKLIAEAVDDVENKTGSLEYTFTFKDKAILEKYYDNKPVFYSSVSIFGVLGVGLIALFTFKRKKVSVK